MKGVLAKESGGVCGLTRGAGHGSVELGWACEMGGNGGDHFEVGKGW